MLSPFLEMAPLTTRAHLLSSLKPLWKRLHRHTQKCISWVISNLVMVIGKIITIAVIVFSNFKPVSHVSHLVYHVPFTLNIK